MINRRILESISSKYITERIFDYIKEKNFKFKLLFYSKLFQNKLGLKLIDFQTKYAHHLGMDLNKYLNSDENEDVNKFNKNCLRQKLEEDLLRMKINSNIFENIVLNVFKKAEEEIINNPKYINVDYKEFENKIEIYSPLIDMISKLGIFEINFTIPISAKIIDKLNLKNDYISKFNKLNESNSKYSSIIFNVKESNDINYLKELKIDFNKIKRLTIIEDNFQKLNIWDYNYFFETLFSLDNIKSNLVYLNLELFKHHNNRIETSLVESLNSFKSLKILYLSGFIFRGVFEIKLNNLNIISLENCCNVNLAENTCLNLKKLNFEETSTKPEFPYEFPNLEVCNLFNVDYQKYDSIINFKSFIKLKIFYGEICDFLNIEGKLLEEIYLYTVRSLSFEMERIMLEQIMLLKNLKKAYIILSKINGEEISIKGENNSVKNLEINWENQIYDCKINNLLKKFPNLTRLKIYIPFYEELSLEYESEPTLNIIENQNSKITKIALHVEDFYDKNIEFFCSPFEYLERVEFILETEFINLKSSFPIFSDKCKIIFKSLNSFHFDFYNDENELNFEIINNIYNNIECMPNLEEFLLYYNALVPEDFCKNFIKKLLHLKLNTIHFAIKNRLEPNDFYTKEELKKLYPEINFNQFKEIQILKYN